MKCLPLIKSCLNAGILLVCLLTAFTARADEATERLIREHAAAVQQHGAMSQEANRIRDDLTDRLWHEGGSTGKRNAAPYLRQMVEFYEQQGGKKGKLMNARARLGQALRINGEYPEARQHLEEAYEYFKDKKGESHRKTVGIMINLGQVLANMEETEAGIAMLEQAVEYREQEFGDSHGKTAYAYMRLGNAYYQAHDYAKAEHYLKDALSIFQLKKGRRNKKTNLTLLQLSKLYMKTGRLNEAEALLQKGFANFAGNEDGLRDVTANAIMSQLGKVLLLQKRYSDAENLLLKSLRLREQQLGAASEKTINTMLVLTDLYLQSGQDEKAEKMAREALANMEGKLGETSKTRAKANIALGNSLLRQGKYQEAEQALSTAHDAFKALDQGNASLRVALGQLYLETGRYDKAEKKLRGAVEKLAETRGQEDPRTTTARTYLAQALANQGKINEAVSQYIQAMDDVNAFLGNRRVYSQQSRTEQEHNVQQMLLGYLDLMVQAHQARADIDVDPVAEGFVIADSIRSRALQAALLGMSARAAAGNEFLADLVRKEQDLKVKLGMLEEKTIDTIENFHGGEQNKKLQGLSRKRKKITKALEKIHERLAYEYPEYSQLMNPVPVRTRDMQSFLADDEVMLTYSVQDNRTILWALTKQQAQMYVIDMGRNALTEKIQFLRRSLEAEASSIADIPSFPVGTAHLLYSRLVQPAAALMQGKQYLVIVPHGPLMSLPFGALVKQQTRQPRATPGSLPFSEYRDVPWLALDYAISQVPSATALHTLRKYAKPAEADLPFVGYGNPAFRGVAESDLGIRGFLKRASANSWNVRELPPLPDTADEIRGIAKTLGADDSDIFLGTRANEENVKGTSLNEYKVIAFATHGLVSGELDGLKQPALALTPPEHMQAGNDGLLEMGEVLGLKLDADWVVLSACNTAAADGSLHGEGLSGLAQAFFYAGSRALLVSLWPVESSSTRLLTTTLFAVDKKNGGISRAQALAQARQRLIKGRGFVKDGKEQFTYAHPMFWAAFIVVGEGAK